MWHYSFSDVNNYDTSLDIEIDISAIKKSIMMVNYDNNIVANLKTNISLIYENLPEFNGGGIKTPLPKNYNDLLTSITKLL